MPSVLWTLCWHQVRTDIGDRGVGASDAPAGQQGDNNQIEHIWAGSMRRQSLVITP